MKRTIERRTSMPTKREKVRMRSYKLKYERAMARRKRAIQKGYRALLLVEKECGYIGVIASFKAWIDKPYFGKFF